MPSSKWSWLALVLTCGCPGRSDLELLPRSPEQSGDGGGLVDAGAVLDAAGRADAPTASDAAREADAGPHAGSEDADTEVAPLVRYDFIGRGTSLRDRVGSAHATVLGGALLDESGRLALDGADDYVDLPNGLLSSLESATIMVWFEWQGGVCWQRVFDFGSSDAGEDQVGQALAALFFTPLACGDERSLAMVEFGEQGLSALGTVDFPRATNTQIAVVYDARLGLLQLYQNGSLAGETAASFALADLMDVNNWLGRSQWVQDRYASVRYDEFRLYGAALSATRIAELAQRGPDAP